MQDQDARSRGVIQVIPGQLDLLQLSEHLVPEGLNGVVVVGLGGVHSKLAVHLLPGEPLRSAEREDPVDEPQVQVEAQGRTA